MYYEHMVTCSRQSASSDGNGVVNPDDGALDIEQKEFLKGANHARPVVKYVRSIYRRVLKAPVIELNRIGFGNLEAIGLVLSPKI